MDDGWRNTGDNACLVRQCSGFVGRRDARGVAGGRFAAMMGRRPALQPLESVYPAG